MKKEKKSNKKEKSIFKKIITALIIIVIITFAVFCAISAYKWQSIATAIMSNTPSTILDINGNVVTEIGAERNQNNISLSSIPQNLINAYISIEDQRFYNHFGIDIKRTGAAIVSYIIKRGNTTFGGSSITQQLVKNITNDNSSSVSRKVVEWIRAIGLEAFLSKEEILEGYLNIIYVGPNIYGVSNGSKYYFDKDVSELTLEECAFLAGLNHSPNSYNPFIEEKDNSEKIAKRTKTVLYKMLELGYISQDECDLSVSKVDECLKFKKGEITSKGNGIYNYHTDAVISEIIQDLVKEKNMSVNFATNYINMAGLKIYSTEDIDIQKQMEIEFNKNKYILPSKNDDNATSQAAMVVIDHKTGYVLGSVGGLGPKTTPRGFNRATQALRQTGSASKPIAVLLPALDKKLITSISIFDDKQIKFNDGTEEGYNPTNYNNYLGNITVRRAVESSQNIPFVSIMEMITPSTSISYLKKLGITSLTDVDNNLNLALGGLDKGISPLQMAGAYSTIANDGTYIEPTYYIKIENNNNRTILKKDQETHKVFSEDVAFILKSLLTEPVNGKEGTATYASIKDIDVSAKTGTTNDNFDRWLCGFTPYYTAVTWFGYDLNETIDFHSQNPAGLIWADVMKEIHSNLPPKKFEKPENVLQIEICKSSNCIATSKCKDTYLEYFLPGTEPKEECNKHK